MEEKVGIVVLQEEKTETGVQAENRDVCAACEHHAPEGHGTMVVPPAYSDLGKDAKDIFTKGYGYGGMKLNIKTMSHNGVKFVTSGSNNTDTGKSGALLETKYEVKNLGLSFSQKWTSDNTLTVDATMEDQLATGLKLGLEALFVPRTGKGNGKLKSAYKRNHMNLGCDLDFDKAAPTVRAAAVLAISSLMGGCQMAYEIKSKMAKYNWALGYQGSDFQVHAHINDETEFGASIYQKVNRNLEAAVNLAWTAGSNNTRFEIGTKYHLHKNSSLSAKINNSGIVGLGYTRTLRPGVNLSLSAMIDGKKVGSGGHKVGMAFEVEA
ncbi:voltage-dependent anion-selective channel protein 3 isoform X2 [Poecilia reticulata]|uniref:voltage-dependent anion-selective channel protein 3 isoform X2 n=1 Tax=Poecilia reticulata TaxID=8081 RepID=UPI0004A3EF8C|nr:PREDICTED: voltage-dependent anion-selective channel protein 3 isoform X2 [Poecilia reticulata]